MSRTITNTNSTATLLVASNGVYQQWYPVQVDQDDAGATLVTYNVTLAGAAQVSVAVNGEPLQGNPFQVSATHIRGCVCSS